MFIVSPRINKIIVTFLFSKKEGSDLKTENIIKALLKERKKEDIIHILRKIKIQVKKHNKEKTH